MKEPTITLQVTYRNRNSNDESDDGVVIQGKEVLNPNDLSGLEIREGTKVTFEADSNSKRPSEASATKDTTWVRHVTRSGQVMGLKSGLYDTSTGGIKSVPGNKHTNAFRRAAMLNYYACLQEIEEEEIKCNNEVSGAYVEFSNMGAGLGGGFEDTN